MISWHHAKILGLTLFALAACKDMGLELPAPLAAAPPEAGEGASPPRISGPVETQPAKPQPSVAPGNATMVTAPVAPKPATGDVSLNFVDADIREIARTILGTILKVNYTIDPAVHGTGTIQTPTPISREQVVPILESLLSQNGASLNQVNGLYRVVATPALQGAPNLVGANNAGSGTKLVPLHYASAADLAKVLEPFVGPGAKVIADPSRNVLLVTGDQGARSSIEEVIRAFDIDTLAGQSFALFPVGNSSPEKVATELEKIFQTGENGALAGVVRVVPMDRVNAVLVVSAQQRYIDEARRLFLLVDQVSSQTERTWHVYYVRNGQSSDLEYVLQRAFTPDHVTATGTSDTNRLGSTVPGLQTSTQSSGSTGGGGGGAGSSSGAMSLQSSTPTGGAGAGGAGGGTGAGGAAGAGASNRAAEQAPPASEPLSSTDSEQKKDRIRIIANRSNNALLVYGTPQEWSMMESMLHKIDILPLQVQIDAVIAEVTLNDQLQYGVQFYFKDGGLIGALSESAAAATTASGFPGFILSSSKGTPNVVINALAQITNVRVLSSPQITVLDNEAATLQVGDQVPYSSGSLTSGLTGSVTSSIEYRETGIILQVIPRVNSGGLVTLDIAQEVSDPVSTTTSAIDSPTFRDRVVKSRVVVQDGQTIGLAGLISDNLSQANGGVPYLKDVPVLGFLFSNQNNTRNRTELLVLLTPHVNNDQRDTRALTDDLRARLWHAGVVPQQLQHIPESGSSDPNDEVRKLIQDVLPSGSSDPNVLIRP